MSIEYTAQLRENFSLEKAQQILQKCSIYEGWNLLDQTPSKMSFKLKGVPVRENWNEDVEISISRSTFYVIFHAASKLQRENCVKYLNECLMIFNVYCYLEEI